MRCGPSFVSQGEISVKVQVTANKFSGSAKTKIEATINELKEEKELVAELLG